MNLLTYRATRLMALLALSLTVSACGLPRSGPNKTELYKSSVTQGGSAHFILVDSRVSKLAGGTPALGFSSSFKNAGRVGSDTINPGDELSITVFENVKDDPLLGNTGQRVSALESVQVDGEGFIFIPYAGKLQAAGQTPDGLRQLITSKLDAQTPDPQVTVQRVAGDGQTVSVAGSVGAQGIYPIERPTRTLSAMIARAGGVAIEPSVAVVRVTRGNQTGQVWMQDLFANPNLDIALRGGDQIVVERDQRAYTALGATGAQSLVPFESQSLSALESLAQVGGLSTTLADPTGVFILRSESASVANAIMGRDDLRGSQRMVYALDLTAPDGLFEARDFQVRDGDTIFVTEAPFSQWTKAVNAVTGTAGAADSLTSIGSSD